MNSSLLPAEHCFSLALNLCVITIASLSLAKLLPQTIDLQAKQHVISEQVLQHQNQVSQLENQATGDRLNPQINARLNANLTSKDSIAIFWDNNQTNREK